MKREEIISLLEFWGYEYTLTNGMLQVCINTDDECVQDLVSLEEIAEDTETESDIRSIIENFEYKNIRPTSLN